MGSLIPRDPRSFPQKDRPLAEMTMVAAQNFLLHGPESVTSTTKSECIDSGISRTYVPTSMNPIYSLLTVLLSQLIAKYGSTTNPSWINPT